MTPPAAKPRFSAETMAIDARFGIPRRFASEALSLLRLPEGGRVLECGCGTGAFTRFALPALGDGGRVVATDLDGAHLAEARTALDGAARSRVAFAAADAMRLPFRDGAFDACVSQFLLCILPGPVVALAEMARVVKPGGVVSSLSCFCKSGALPPFPGIGEWPGRARFEELFPRFRATYRTTVRNPNFGLPNGRDLDVWGDYARAGLVDLRIDGFMPVFAPADARWSPEEAGEYAERRERVDVALLENLSETSLATLAANGFSRAEVAELLALTQARYKHLRSDLAAIRGNMDAVADPAVLISGRVPDRPIGRNA